MGLWRCEGLIFSSGLDLKLMSSNNRKARITGNRTSELELLKAGRLHSALEYIFVLSSLNVEMARKSFVHKDMLEESFWMYRVLE